MVVSLESALHSILHRRSSCRLLWVLYTLEICSPIILWWLQNKHKIIDNSACCTCNIHILCISLIIPILYGWVFYPSHYSTSNNCVLCTPCLHSVIFSGQDWCTWYTASNYIASRTWLEPSRQRTAVQRKTSTNVGLKFNQLVCICISGLYSSWRTSNEKDQSELRYIAAWREIPGRFLQQFSCNLAILNP